MHPPRSCCRRPSGLTCPAACAHRYSASASSLGLGTATPQTALELLTQETLVHRPQRLDPLEERTDGEVVGERLLVLTAGHPDLLAVGSVQPGVVPHNRPGRGGLAPLGRADRWAPLAAHRASLARVR